MDEKLKSRLRSHLLREHMYLCREIARLELYDSRNNKLKFLIERKLECEDLVKATLV